MDAPPFPPLFWDGLYWRSPVIIPWHPAAATTELVVRPDYSRSCEPVGVEAAPRPADTQAAAYRDLMGPDSALPRALLPQFRRFVPELADSDWDGVRSFFELATALIFHPSWDDESYLGLRFNCLRWDYGYEHGVGIIAHKARVVHFGMAEEAQDEGLVLRDIRRQARARRGGRPT